MSIPSIISDNRYDLHKMRTTKTLSGVRKEIHILNDFKNFCMRLILDL